MARSTRWALSVAVAASLTVPAWAWGQTAVRRTDPPSGGSGSSSSGSSGGSSSSGSSDPGRSSGGSGVESRPPSLPPIPSLDPPRQRSAPASGKASAGSAVPKGGTTTTSGASSTTRSRGAAPATTGRDTTPSRTGGSSIVGRDRGDRLVTGTAVDRPLIGGSPNLPINIIFFDPWNRWYSGRYGYSGVGYNRYGCGSWCYGSRWGYDPFWYDPFYGYGYNPHNRYYPYDPYDEYGYSTSRREDAPRREVGSLRIKAKPANAQIFVDGVLVGIVDDFDGLTNHLELDAGPHQLEIRADGYETLVTDVTVRTGKTLTERMSLRKKK